MADERPLLGGVIQGATRFAYWAARIWRTSGYGQAAGRLRQHRQFPATAVGALIFLSLVIAGVTADEALARAFRVVSITTFEASSAWWALPPALAALVCLNLPGYVRPRPFIMAGGAGLLLALLLIRRQLVPHGALPYIALRESVELFTYGLLVLTAWLYADRYPGAAPLLLGLGVATIAISRWSGAESRSPFRPDLLPLVYSLPLALVAGLEARRGAGGSGEDGSFERRPMMQMTGLGAGLLVGLTLSGIEPGRTGSLTLAEILGSLWAESVLWGHGHGTLIRLLRVWTEPATLAEPWWTGWSGTLAVGGVAAVVVISVLSALLLWCEARGRIGLKSAGLAAQLTAGMMISGGPNSTVPALAFGLWFALALGWKGEEVGETATFEAGGDWPRRLGPICQVGSLVALATASLLMRAPFTSARILSQIRPEDLQEEGLEERLEHAELLNPWNPATHLVRAAWLREALTRSPEWDESVYARICSEYEDAIALDPYEPAIILKLAEVQSIAERTDDAIRTAQEGLRLNPGSPDLMSWIFFYATSNNRMEVAAEIIDRSLLLNPEGARWWKDRFRFERTAGRGPEAGAALNVALTAAVGGSPEMEAELVRAALDRTEDGAHPDEPADEGEDEEPE